MPPTTVRTEVDAASALDDAALIRGTLKGRREDFDALVERYQKPLYAFACRVLGDKTQAADIVQTTFLQAYTHLAQFAGRASFKTWLHQIALNQCRALHRGSRSRRLVSLDDVSEANLREAQLQAVGVGGRVCADGPATVDSGTGDSAWGPALRRLVARLPLRQRAVVTLRIFADLPFKEIARVEGMSENSAKVNYHHAITRLRQWLKESDT
jgi:RNA polymerase sigma-70 factor (ECF subfamily)